MTVLLPGARGQPHSAADLWTFSEKRRGSNTLTIDHLKENIPGPRGPRNDHAVNVRNVGTLGQ